MSRLASIAAAAALLLAGGPVFASAPPATPSRSEAQRPAPTSGGALLLDASFPIEVAIAPHAGLLHWLDSLAAMNGAGLTAGKSVEGHRAEFNKRLGRPSAEDRQVLLRYIEARKTSVTGRHAAAPDVLAAAFFQAATQREALDALPALLDEAAASELREALLYFAPRYEKIWDGGQVPRAFVQRVRQDPARPAVAAFLMDVAAFYGVPPVSDPPPRVQLVPVIDGYGTHAQAVGRHLLIEVRPWEGLPQQLGPLVHENAHFLFERVDPARVKALRDVARALPHGEEAWDALHEALPTAIAQGVACERFGLDTWSERMPWYHREEIDYYAKRLFTLVGTALANGGAFDEAFVRRAVALFTPR